MAKVKGPTTPSPAEEQSPVCDAVILSEGKDLALSFFKAVQESSFADLRAVIDSFPPEPLN